jgi:hypothetical protein
MSAADKKALFNQVTKFNAKKANQTPP